MWQLFARWKNSIRLPRPKPYIALNEQIILIDMPIWCWTLLSTHTRVPTYGNSTRETLVNASIVECYSERIVWQELTRIIGVKHKILDKKYILRELYDSAWVNITSLYVECLRCRILQQLKWRGKCWKTNITMNCFKLIIKAAYKK